MRTSNDLYRIFYNPESNQYELDESKRYTLVEIDNFGEKDNKVICDADPFFEEKVYALDAIRARNQLIAKGFLKTCKDCGRKFWQDDDEVYWFESRGMLPPKRCSRCRAKRKAEKK